VEDSAMSKVTPFDAKMKMVRLDVAALERAYAQA
jgi:hypothetical protein